MKALSLAITISGVVGLSACGSLKFGNDKPGVTPEAVVAVKQEVVELSTEFKREGVQVFYTLTGAVDRVEAKGFADVWQQRYEHVAELEAKEKMVKFLRGESVSSSRKTQVIAKAIERAQDNTINRFKKLDGTSALSTTAEELEATPENKSTESNNNKEENARDNTALRKASINNAQTVTSNITVTSAGRLSAVRKAKGEIVNEGKTYVGTYVWTPRDQEAARSIIRMMDAK